MRHVKVLLQLHSIKLILFSALAIIFMAMMSANSSNKTDTIPTDVSVTDEKANSFAVAGSGTTRVKKEIE